MVRKPYYSKLFPNAVWLLPLVLGIIGFTLPRTVVAAPTMDTNDFWVGGDISFLSKIEQLGGVYKDHGLPGDALQIFKRRGANTMRLRLWVHPDGQGMNISDLPYTLALAQRVKKAGFKLLLDIHYSDTWADPGHQSKPAAWKDLSFYQLTEQVETYSRETIAAFRKGGAMPDMVQIGNETPNGMLWPEGKVEETGGWKRYGTLLKAAISGVKAGSLPMKSPLIMIHINNAAQSGLATWFFDNLKAEEQGIQFDVIGLSYYPEPSMRLEELKKSLAIIANKYHKPIVIAETGYPSGGIPVEEQAKWDFPPTPDGQRAFLHALITTVRDTPLGLGRGVIWWEPEWVPINGLGHYYGDKMLFDRDFNALPALDALTAKPSKQAQSHSYLKGTNK
ncbi:MAG: arabinogalactan endo-1,4-beta-galactosidase [Armatimonadota bacterium]|nr:arabinogalactan endo-1,4-beta-galactosidase [Armatimonadota bacterium]